MNIAQTLGLIGQQGPPGQPGLNGEVTNDFLKNNSLWCADGQICTIPATKTGIDFGTAQFYNSINAKGNLADFKISTKNDLYINGNTLHITQNKLYSNSRDILGELDIIKKQINDLMKKS